MTTVSVTQEDIDNGKTCHAQECAFARALARVLPPGTKIAVGVLTARLNDTDIILPWQVERWTADYDYGRPVSPATFELDLEAFA